MFVSYCFLTEIHNRLWRAPWAFYIVCEIKYFPKKKIHSSQEIFRGRLNSPEFKYFYQEVVFRNLNLSSELQLHLRNEVTSTATHVTPFWSEERAGAGCLQKVCVPIADQDMQKVDFSRHCTLLSHVLEHTYQNECKLKIQMRMHRTHPQTCSQAHTNTFICTHTDTHGRTNRPPTNRGPEWLTAWPTPAPYVATHAHTQPRMWESQDLAPALPTAKSKRWPWHRAQGDSRVEPSVKLRFLRRPSCLSSDARHAEHAGSLFSLAESCWVSWPRQSLSNQNRILAKQMTCELGICGPGRRRPVGGGRRSGGEERGKLLVNTERWWRREFKRQYGRQTSVLDVKSKNWIQIPALACKSYATLNMLNCLFELWFIL